MARGPTVHYVRHLPQPPAKEPEESEREAELVFVQPIQAARRRAIKELRAVSHDPHRPARARRNATDLLERFTARG